MRHSTLLFLVVVLLAPAAAAQTADLEATSLTVDKTTVVMGERLTVTARVRNNGPSVASQVLVHINSGAGLPLSLDAPAGWSCRRWISVSPAAVCSTPALAVGAEAEFRASGLAPPRRPGFGIQATVNALSQTSDPRPDNSSRTSRLTLVDAPNKSDLGVTVTDHGTVRERAEAGVDVAVTNHGPSTATNIVVAVIGREETLPNASGTGDGWTCTASMEGLLCRRAALNPGATSTIAARFDAPQHEASLMVMAIAQAEMNHDVEPKNDLGFAFLWVGSPESWRRILLPLASEYIPGANRSAWKTEVTMLIRSDKEIEIEPGPCPPLVNPCFSLPRQVPTSVQPLVWHDVRGGQLLYVRPEDEEKLSFNARVFDQARTEETAGAEIPIVREHELHTSTISLLNIPAAPHYRHTLRIYDADARQGSRVLIHVYAGSEQQPRVSAVRSLARPEETFPVTTARLPSHPSYAQLDLRELLPLDGFETVRVDIEPLDPGLRFWAFVSLTNNNTHHVTTVTPQ